MKCIYDTGKGSEKVMQNVAKNCDECVDTRSGIACVEECVIELLERNLEFKNKLLGVVEKYELLAKSEVSPRHYTYSNTWKFAQAIRSLVETGLRVSDEKEAK